jgi:hypothetical protein
LIRRWGMPTVCGTRPASGNHWPDRGW